MANQTIINNLEELSREEIIEEYTRLSRLYTELKESDDAAQQKVYELRRNLELANNREAFLTHELETINEQHDVELRKICDKQRDEIDELRRRLVESKESVSNLESELEQLRTELAEAKQIVPAAAPATTNDSTLSDHQMEYLAKLEAENMQMIEVHNEINCKYLDVLRQVSEVQQTADNWKDRCECAEENLTAKRNELEEERTLSESLQEKMVHLSSELASFKSNAADMNKKGNSLFAEVDDQRQYMRNLLANQKLHYNKMKQEHADSQRKIRMLKRENGAMRREVEICSQMFKQADQFHKNKLLDRIYYLNQEVEQLQGKLKRTEQQLLTVAKKNDADWISATLDLCKFETEKLKADLKSCRLQKADIEDKYFIAMEQQSKWRFEALKSRCIIIERESLLEDNKIDFKPLDNIEVNKLVYEKYKDVTKETPLIDCGRVIVENTVLKQPNVENVAKRPASRIADISIELFESDKLDNSVTNPDGTIVLMSGESFLATPAAMANCRSEVEMADATDASAKAINSNDAVSTTHEVLPTQVTIAASQMDTSLSPLRKDECEFQIVDEPSVPSQSNVLRQRDENASTPDPKQNAVGRVMTPSDISWTLKYRPIKINASRLDFLHKNGSERLTKENNSSARLMPPPSAIGNNSVGANPIKYAPKARPIIKHMKVTPE